MNYSVLIPVYNGAATIGPLVERLLGVPELRPSRIILVNDGSIDDSDRVCREIHESASGVVTYVKLAKNFGEHNAVMAGLHYVVEDYVVVMDDDFQNPPEEAGLLVRHAARENHDVVFARYEIKHHHWFRNLGSRFNNAVATLLLGKPSSLYLASFKCMNLFLVKEIRKYSGPFPYIDGLALRCTRNIGVATVRHDPRREGRSNYTLGKLTSLWLNMFVNFSVVPLRISACVGFGLSVLSVILCALVIVERVTRPETPVGWASVVVAVVFFAGVQLTTLGLLGEYLGRVLLTCNQTPQFVVREVRGGVSG